MSSVWLLMCSQGRGGGGGGVEAGEPGTFGFVPSLCQRLNCKQASNAGVHFIPSASNVLVHAPSFY